LGFHIGNPRLSLALVPLRRITHTATISPLDTVYEKVWTGTMEASVMETGVAGKSMCSVTEWMSQKTESLGFADK
jgi:hypothetical protein